MARDELGILAYIGYALRAIVSAPILWVGMLARQCWYGDKGRD